MDRRTLLRALVGGGGVGLGGCLGRTASDPRSTTDNWEHTPSSCPSPISDEATVYCGTTGSDHRIEVTASTTSLPMSRATLTITLQNIDETAVRAEQPASQFYAWRRGTWTPISMGPIPAVANPISIEPGDQLQVQVHQYGDSLDPVEIPREDMTQDRRTFAFRFMPGVYAFGYSVYFDSESTTTAESGSELTRHLYTKRFRVTGEPPALLPSNAVSNTSRENNTLFVRTQTDVVEDARNVSLIAEQLSSTPDSATSVTLFDLYNPSHPLSYRDGDVPRPELLRDGFAHYEGSADQIRIETRRSVVPALGINEPRTIVYDGTPWQITAVNGWR